MTKEVWVVCQSLIDRHFQCHWGWYQGRCAKTSDTNAGAVIAAQINTIYQVMAMVED
jgi:hypothetical protein